LDIATNSFHAHGADEHGEAVFSRKLSRGKLLDFFASRPALPRSDGGLRRGASARLVSLNQTQFDGYSAWISDLF
jgi:hypothetical protein